MKLNKKRIFLLFSTLLIALLLSNIFAYSTTNINPQYGVTTANVNLRFNPSTTSSSKIKLVNKNSALKIVGTIDNFNIVQLESNDVGLISKNYIKSSDEAPKSAKTYENLTKFYATVNAPNVALRAGPATSFKVNERLKEGTKVEVIGRIENFYMVVTENNNVGMIREDLLNKSSAQSPDETEKDVILRLINEERKKAGRPLLTVDSTLEKAAQTKADDMVKNNYFSHTSPTYGSPFKMIQDFGISYKAAGENIAGNPSIEAAVESWLKSDEHKKNILSNAYNYVGIGVANSKTYGYIIVLMFIGK